MSRAAFFAALRARNSGVFGTSLSQSQVEGIEAILDAGDRLPLSHLAYALATAYGETGGRMQPIHENMNYTAARMVQVWPSRFKTEADAAPYARQPEKLANLVYGGRLGNTAPGDGWRYRGRGLVQITGKDNYAKVGRLVGVDLVADPDASLQIGIAARALIYGIRDGIYTGKKAADYLPGDYVNARRIINGTFEAQKYAGYARAFDAALVAAGYSGIPIIATIPPRAPEDPASAKAPLPPLPAPEPKDGLLAWILGMFKRKERQ
jgi:putative chitinase